MQVSFLSGLLCGTLATVLCAATMVMAQSDSEAALTSCLTDEQKALLGKEIDGAQAILPQEARIIPPDSAVTQDYRPERVNVDLDEDGVVIRVWCG